MRLLHFITEDYEEALEYKKAVFDLQVALGNFGYLEKKKSPDPLERENDRVKMQIIHDKIVRLKQKILKLSHDMGESITPKLQKVLDRIPNEEEMEGDAEEEE